MPPRVIDEDLSHQMRCDAEEMRPALPVGHVLGDEAHVRLVHERSRLQRHRRALVAEVVRGEAAQLVVDNRNQRLDRAWIAVLDIEEEQRHIRSLIHRAASVPKRRDPENRKPVRRAGRV